MKVKIKETAKAKKGWSLYRLAKELKMEAKTVYTWGNGSHQPSYKKMDKLCEILDCTMNDLFEAEKSSEVQ